METLCPTSLVSNSKLFMHEGRSTWTKEENKTFENALAFFDEQTPNRWFKVAAMIPGKSVYDVMNQYMELVADLNDIEAGLVPIPGYFSSSFSLKFHRGCDQERKKGIPWTEDEHRRFLVGLKMHGKGDWKNISRNYVVSKTPTQVASHAQKYYLRKISGGKEKRRPSIHDITVTCADKPNELASVNWNDEKNGANLVVLDSDFGESLIQSPFNVSTQDFYIDGWLI